MLKKIVIDDTISIGDLMYYRFNSLYFFGDQYVRSDTSNNVLFHDFSSSHDDTLYRLGDEISIGTQWIVDTLHYGSEVDTIFGTLYNEYSDGTRVVMFSGILSGFTWLDELKPGIGLVHWSTENYHMYLSTAVVNNELLFGDTLPPNSTDSIYYYNPDSIYNHDCQEWDSTVTNFRVHFTTIDLGWSKYDVSEIHFLMNNESSQLISIFTNSDSLVASINWTQNDNDPYPIWQKLDVSSFPSLWSLFGNFYIQGNFLRDVTTNIDPSFPGHNFVLSYNGTSSEWIETECTFALKVFFSNVELKIDEGVDSMPDCYQLGPILPNPFNNSTKIIFTIPHNGTFVRIDVYNILGKHIATIDRSIYKSGVHNIIWDSRDSHQQPVPSGIYLVELRSHHFTDKRKILLIK